VIAGVGAATVLSYSILGDYFPKEIAGQANAALNLLHIGGAFVLQEAIGLIVNHWPSLGGHYPPLAYKTAFALVVLLQIGGIIWFVPSLRMARAPQPQPAE
jgi:MFS family permease